VAGEARTALSELTSMASRICLRKVRIIGRNGYAWKSDVSFSFKLIFYKCKLVCNSVKQVAIESLELCPDIELKIEIHHVYVPVS